MLHIIIPWIYMIQICQAQSEDSYNAKSLGTIVGIVLIPFIIIVTIFIIIIFCMKKNWRKVRHKRSRRTNSKRTTNTTSRWQRKSASITDNIVERLPDIHEEERFAENLVSIRSGSNITLHQIDSEASKTEAAKNEINKTSDDLNRIPTATTESQIAEIMHEINGVSGENIEINSGSEHEESQDTKSEVSISRVIENQYNLRKNVPSLNSIENLFSEYDPAMTYSVESKWKLESYEGLHLNRILSEQSSIALKAFEITRDDSDLNLKSKTKMETEALVESKIHSKSEGTLADVKKKKPVKRRASLLSKKKGNPCQWTFNYKSPYALTDKQKRENYESKLKIQKRRKQTMRRKFFEKERRHYENNLAFEKWKRQKHEERTKYNQRYSGSLKSINFKKNRHWYP